MTAGPEPIDFDLVRSLIAQLREALSASDDYQPDHDLIVACSRSGMVLFIPLDPSDPAQYVDLDSEAPSPGRAWPSLYRLRMDVQPKHFIACTAEEPRDHQG